MDYTHNTKSTQISIRSFVESTLNIPTPQKLWKQSNIKQRTHDLWLQPVSCSFLAFHWLRPVFQFCLELPSLHQGLTSEGHSHWVGHFFSVSPHPFFKVSAESVQEIKTIANIIISYYNTINMNMMLVNYSQLIIPCQGKKLRIVNKFLCTWPAPDSRWTKSGS